MPVPSSAATWRAVKYIVRKAGDIVPPTLLYLSELLTDEAEAEPLRWVRVHVRYARNSPAGTQEDLAEFKLDLLNITGGAIDTSWTSGDFAGCTTALDTFTTSLAGFMANNHTLKQYRYYAMGFDSADPGPGLRTGSGHGPFLDTGPPVQVVTKNTVGAANIQRPYQVAATITLKTGWPKHWGRIYLPGPALGLDAYGRWNAADAQNLANIAFDLQDDLAAQGFLVTVPVTQLGAVRTVPGSGRFHALLGVNQVVVDDIPDVVRRRRPKTTLLRQVGIE